MEASESSWFSIADVDKLDTPALVVFPERIKHNINLLKTMIGDVNRLRPHVKTHKSQSATELCLAVGINKFKCATIAEAEMLGMSKANDVLLAYQPAGPKLERFIALIKNYHGTMFSCLIDNKETAAHISDVAYKNGIKIPVFIDLNVGMNRTGIAPDERALELFLAVRGFPGIIVKGLHAYDGHIHDADCEIRKFKYLQAFSPVEKLVAELKANNIFPIIIAGGTPTFPFFAARNDVECSPGTFIYWDAGYEQAFSEQTFLPSAVLVSRIISLPDSTKICLDLGHKSVASENVLEKRVVFLNAGNLKFVGHSEEHLILDAGEGHSFKTGDVLYGIPYHVCPTVALYERAVIIENHQILGEWPTIARDRKINF
ncbi:D-TA family PLP-dependent enzyme [Pedobacter sp. HMF7647]|uniref:D-TA family PLP-dependent enzyme n=1 Tax=Hufsiella arboris TaxID=2695275 RepID=A0A7K1Y5N0_9SPHI|nr:D-TA family PLP-dependent enzyme [Hufsiella arboris]MXV49691.1 D-TA family PLP-dependent enzyme [Hufsiella arboris]